MKNNVFAYCLCFIIGVVSTFLIKKCEDKNVYLENGTYIYHNNPVCDSIHGFDKEAYNEYGDVLGSEKISEKEVFYNKKYKMCEFCFSKMEIQSRYKYIYK